MRESLDRIIGKMFGRLTVVSRSKRKDIAGRKPFFRCRCSCGTMTEVRWPNLFAGRTKSCGCLKTEILLSSKFAGLVGRTTKDVPEYYIWRSMIQRCYNRNRKDFPRYGGSGVTVCQEWKESFASFYESMGPRPTNKHTIERKNGVIGYNPENCVWATKKEQARNRVSNTIIKHNGESATLAEWVERTGIGGTTIRYRLDAGWSVKDALSRKPRGR